MSGGVRMKKISYFIFVIFIIFSFCVIGCRSPEKDPDVARLQAEVEALKKSLLSTQQELAYTRESMTDLMEQTSAIQSQVQEEKECTVSCENVQNCLPYAAEIVPSPYYLYPNQCAGYNPFLPYGYRTSLWNWPPPPNGPAGRMRRSSSVKRTACGAGWGSSRPSTCSPWPSHTPSDSKSTAPNLA